MTELMLLVQVTRVVSTPAFLEKVLNHLENCTSVSIPSVRTWLTSGAPLHSVLADNLTKHGISNVGQGKQCSW